MLCDSDVVLLGTGAAPLVAAYHLLSAGKSVVLLNPDRDFFLEDSELPLAPAPGVTRKEWGDWTLEGATRILQPSFPGALESWSSEKTRDGFHDLQAPHLRQRQRLWIGSREMLEDLYLRAETEGLNPRFLDEPAAPSRRFPGHSGGNTGSGMGLQIPDSGDVDVELYRNGLLEFVRERLGPNRIFPGAMQVEITPEGVRFTAGPEIRSIRVAERILVFWTPRLSSWVKAQCEHRGVKAPAPAGVRLWEQWGLISRHSMDPRVIGHWRDLTVWAEASGRPGEEMTHLSILRSPGLLTPGEYQSGVQGGRFGTEESFQSLRSLCCEFLGWDRYSIRSLRVRGILEWERPTFFRIQDRVKVILGSDGPLVDVVKHAKYAADLVNAADRGPHDP